MNPVNLIHVKRGARSTLFYFIGLLILFFTLFPITWLGISSFKSRSELFELPVRYLPRNPTFAAYKELFSKEGEAGSIYLPWQKYLLNSTIVAGGSTLFLLVMATSAGYGFSRFKFKGDKLTLAALVVTRMLPGPALIVPIYLILNKLGPSNRLLGLILVHTTLGIPLCTWLIVGFFNSVPSEIEEAAIVDGCTKAQSFFHVVLPIARIGIISVGIFQFAGSWSEYGFASVILEDQKMRTAPIGFANWLFLFGSSDFNKVGAAAITMAMPINILFMIFQKHFVRGMIEGSIKG